MLITLEKYPPENLREDQTKEGRTRPQNLASKAEDLLSFVGLGTLLPMSKKSQAKNPSEVAMLAMQANQERAFPVFWQQVQQFAADADCPPLIRDFFRAMLENKRVLVKAERAPFFLQLVEDIEGWSPVEASTDPWACPVLFLEAEEAEVSQPPPPSTSSRTAQVLDMRSGAVQSLPLSGEVVGICVPDSAGTLILGAPPGLSIEELKERMARMTGLSEVSLIPGPMVSLPDGAFFALLTPGAKAGSTDLLDYFLYQLLGKDGGPPQPPQRPWEA